MNLMPMKIPDTKAIYADMAKRLPDFCTCEKCGRRLEVNAAECLAKGWPRCCGETMTLGGIKNMTRH